MKTLGAPDATSAASLAETKKMNSHLPGLAISCTLVLASFLFCACSTDHRQTPDAVLEQNFYLHEAEFDSLVTTALSDGRFGMISAKQIRYGGHTLPREEARQISDAGFTAERVRFFDALATKLGIVQITKSEGLVELRVDAGTVWNGDTSKGYLYTTREPYGEQASNLDSQNLSRADRSKPDDIQRWKPLKRNWFLYVFIGR